jgi:hypothetical protein
VWGRGDNVRRVLWWWWQGAEVSIDIHAVEDQSKHSAVPFARPMSLLYAAPRHPPWGTSGLRQH